MTSSAIIRVLFIHFMFYFLALASSTWFLTGQAQLLAPPDRGSLHGALQQARDANWKPAVHTFNIFCLFLWSWMRVRVELLRGCDESAS
jgi:hypothetical protein